MYRVWWPGGERLVDVPKRADVELVWAVPAWRWVQVPFRERASVLPHWQPWVRESGGRVVVLMELQVAVAGSPLALIYRAVARVMRTLGCPPGPAVLWLLCGPETFRPAVGWSRTFGSWGHSTSWVELTLLVGLPVDAVIDSYRKATAQASKWAGPATPSLRPVDERTLALAEFWFGWVERAAADRRSTPPGLERPLPGLTLRARCLILASAPQQRLGRLPGRPAEAPAALLTCWTPSPPTRAAGFAGFCPLDSESCVDRSSANTCSEPDNWHQNWHQ